MSIEGLIERVKREPNGSLTSELCGRQAADGYSPPGQPYLRIVQPTWEPKVGMTIWGGSNSVRIETDDGGREYVRWGYVKLIEAGREKEARRIGYPGAESG